LRFGMPTIGGGGTRNPMQQRFTKPCAQVPSIGVNKRRLGVLLGAEHVLHGLGDEIVIGVADDFHRREFAEWELAAKVNASVNVWSIGFASGDKVFARFEPMGIFAAHETVLP